jgi:hypothetical protein
MADEEIECKNVMWTVLSKWKVLKGTKPIKCPRR